MDDENSPIKLEPGVELNRRGIPARKRKKNSLIFGDDDLVSLPIRSPRKKAAAKPASQAPLHHTTSRAEKQHHRAVEKEAKQITSPQKTMKPEATKNGVLSTWSIKKEHVAVVAEEEQDNAEDFDEDDEELDEDNEEQYAELSEEDGLEDEEDNSPLSILYQQSGSQRSREDLDSQLENEDRNSLLNRHNAQRLGVALRNLLKLPKAHKWVCFEFFYSNIDRVLFHGENDFMVCLRESFPHLKTRMLTRVEWCKIRRLMGKPRRFSEAFLKEERSELERKRKRIRLLQQRKVADAQALKDLPDEIPLQLTIGSKVTARLRAPQDGLFTGTVEAVDTSNSTYRITFHRPGLGTHSIPDYEVLSVDPPDLIPISSFLNRPRLRPMPPPNSFPSPVIQKYGSLHSPLTNDPLLSGTTPRTKTIRLDQVLGGYPVKFLYNIVRLNKCLKAKKEKVIVLRDLNSEAEKKKSFGETITEDFQRKYASTVLEIYKMNEELNSQLRDIADFTTQLGGQDGPSLSLPDEIWEHCQEESYDMVNRFNSGHQQQQLVHSPRLLALITQLSALMLQVKQVADGERNAAELQALKDSLARAQGSLTPNNVRVFKDHVEVHMQHIQQGLSQMGNLTAFMKTEDGQTTS